MSRKRWKVGGIVTSTNKKQKPVNVIVFADSEKAAKNQGITKIKKANPDGFVRIGKVQED